MTVTEASEGRVLTYLTRQELQLLEGSLEEILECLHLCGDFKECFGFEREEAHALKRQIAQARDMIERGTEQGAFGQLRPKAIKTELG